MNKNLSVSGVLQEAWGKFRENLQFIYYLLAPAFIISFLGIIFYPEASFFQSGGNQAEAASTLLSVLLSLLSALAGVFATISLLFFFRRGKKDTWANWKEYLRLLPKYIGVCILQGLMILAGLVLLIIPGIYLAVRYAFVSYRTLEHPTESIKDLFAAEAKATEGNRVALLLIGIVLIVIAMVIGGLLSVFLPGFAGSRGNPAVDFLFELLVTPFFTIVSIVTYLKLTDTKEPETVVEEKAPEAPKEEIIEPKEEQKPATTPTVEPVV